MIALTRFFIERHRLVALILALVTLLGLMSLGALRYELMPSMDLGVVKVTTAKAGASPEDVELSISLVLEEELLKVDGIDRVISQSMEGLSLITLNLDPDFTDRSRLRSEIQQAVDRAESRLPGDLLEKPLIESLGSDQLPIAELHITGAVSEELLREQARRWQQKLRNVPGVSGIERVGYRRPEIQIQLDQGEMQRLQIGIDEIVHAIEQRNLRASGGSVSTADGEKAILTSGVFSEPADAGATIVRSKGPGNALRLQDIAQIVSGYEDWEVQSRINGRVGIALHINKTRAADELTTVSALRERIAAEIDQLPEGVELYLVNDVSRFTKSMLQSLASNAWMGFAAVLVVLWAFLGQRVAFWVSVGLPFSIFGTFLALLFLGFSVNALTLVAMILVLGMLVDDAIVTAESIQARRESGLSYIDAAIAGTRDIAAPVSASVLTTILAFLPLLTLGGLEGEFVRVIPVVVALMLSISLFESKLLLPAHLAHSPYKAHRRSWLVSAQRRYHRLLDSVLRHRRKACLVILTIFALLFVAASSTVRWQLYPETALDTILVKVELENGTAFEETVTRIRRLETELRSAVPEGDLLDSTAEIGHHDTDVYGVSEGRNHAWALLTLYLRPLEELQQAPAETLAALRDVALVQRDLKSIIVEPLKDTPILGMPVQLEILSESLGRREAAERVKRFLESLPGVTDVWDSTVAGKDVLQLDFDDHKLAAYGLSVRQVSEAVRVALDGMIVAEQQLSMERAYLRLKFPHAQRHTLDALRELFITNQNGLPVALSSVADFRLRPDEGSIKHFNGLRTTTVYGQIDRRVTDVRTVNAQLSDYLANAQWRSLYPQIDFYQGGELEQQEQSFGNLGIAFVAAILMILFVLVLLFDSFSEALLILAVLPFSLVGVLLAFAVQGLPVSFLALTGVLGLIGVLINDSVVMMHALRAGGDDYSAAAFATRATTRFRPVVITSITTLAGLLPTAYGWGGDNPLVVPMVMAMAWGILFGTLISLFLLPCLYALNCDAGDWIRRVCLRTRCSTPNGGEAQALLTRVRGNASIHWRQDAK